MALPDPVIFVPGITATYLRDEYRLPPDIVWSVLTKNYERVALHPDNLRYELVEPARITPDQVFEVAYREMIEELRFNLSPSASAAVPVYPFGYDWRQPLEVAEIQLGRFIEEVIERTKLLKHYHAAGYREDAKVNLVGHSMGGLIIAGYLQRAGNAAPIRKVVTMATPFRGSLEAPLKITTGTAELGTGRSGSRERRAARLTPGLYHLLPSFAGAIDAQDPIPDSLFEISAWQPSVVTTIGEFIRSHGLEPENHEERARELFQQLLAEARAHRDRVEGLSLADVGLGVNDWLAIVGADSDTRVALGIEQIDGVPRFNLDSTHRRNEWSSPDPAERVKTGDGTVPFLGAMNGFVPPEKVVCVIPDDFGYWEIEDRILVATAGFHGIMANMNMLHRMVVHFLTSKDPAPDNIWGHRPPNLPDGAEWLPPIPGLQSK